MPVNEDMAYGFADKIGFPHSGFNGITFMLKNLVPCNPGFSRLRVCPPAELPGSNSEYPASLFLGKASSDSIVYYSDHGFFNLLFKMTA